MNRRDFLQYGLASLAASTLPLPALAAFPERPIKLIVPFSPGGATDVVGRLWAERMKGKFGTVVTENKGGGGGVIGATEVARSTPNGETLLFGNSSTQVIIPAIAEKPSYGSAGAGTMTNLSGELFKELIGVKDITHIPYKGSAPGVADLASGHIPMMTPNVGGPLLQFHAQGKIRILAVAANKRLAAAPDIPTAIE